MTTNYTGSESNHRARRATQIVRTRPHKRGTGVHAILCRALFVLAGPNVLADLIQHAFGPLGRCVAMTAENSSLRQR